MINAGLVFIEKTLNRALQTDELAARQLAKLHNLSFVVDSSLPAFCCYMQVESAQVRLRSGRPDAASVTLRGSLPQLVAMGARLARQQQAELSGSGVTIEGDIGALLTLSRCMAGLDIDWEAMLAAFVGEVPARFAFMGLEQMHSSAPLWQERLRQVGSDLALGPVGAASQEELLRLQERTRQLQYRLDRLQARIRQLPKYNPESLA